MSTGNQCFCGRNCHYTDWTVCEECTAIRALAGRETTKAQCERRSAWDMRMAEAVRGRPFGEIAAAGHLRAAEAYKALAATKP